MTLTPEMLRQAMRAWTTGVAIVTAAHGDERHGMTINSFTSVALEPPLIIVSLQTTSRTHRLVSLAGAFGVTILSAEQKELSERFAGRLAGEEDRLAGLQTETLVTGAPLLKGGLASLDCRVVQTIAAGTNTLFLAEVVAVYSEKSDQQPLVYHNRGYWKLSAL
jgi:flavin reductase (DIM6/NTAB) family NADH-FMN oxidoreductase RutF